MCELDGHGAATDTLYPLSSAKYSVKRSNFTALYVQNKQFTYLKLRITIPLLSLACIPLHEKWHCSSRRCKLYPRISTSNTKWTHYYDMYTQDNITTFRNLVMREDVYISSSNVRRKTNPMNRWYVCRSTNTVPNHHSTSPSGFFRWNFLCICNNYDKQYYNYLGTSFLFSPAFKLFL